MLRNFVFLFNQKLCGNQRQFSTDLATFCGLLFSWQDKGFSSYCKSFPVELRAPLNQLRAPQILSKPFLIYYICSWYTKISLFKDFLYLFMFYL